MRDDATHTNDAESFITARVRESVRYTSNRRSARVDGRPRAVSARPHPRGAGDRDGGEPHRGARAHDVQYADGRIAVGAHTFSERRRDREYRDLSTCDRRTIFKMNYR
jgi:hypothetical protein